MAEIIVIGREQEALTLGEYLARLSPEVSRRRFKRLFREGKILVNGHRTKFDDAAQEGDRLEVEADLSSLPRESERRELLPVIYEDDYLLAVNKPPGLSCQGGKFLSRSLLTLLRERHPKQELVLFHRLDKDTSGVLLLLKGRGLPQERLLGDLKARRVKKQYLALVDEIPSPVEGGIDRPLSRGTRNRRVVSAGEGVTARTSYIVQEVFPSKVSLHSEKTMRVGRDCGVSDPFPSYPLSVLCRPFSSLEMTPETGKMHQIRIHLSALGHPLAVDRLYGERRILRLFDCIEREKTSWPGNRNPVVIGRTPLHARRLEFVHPVSRQPVALEAPVPPDIERALNWLRALRTGRIPP